MLTLIQHIKKAKCLNKTKKKVNSTTNQTASTPNSSLYQKILFTSFP